MDYQDHEYRVVITLPDDENSPSEDELRLAIYRNVENVLSEDAILVQMLPIDDDPTSDPTGHRITL